MTDPLVTVRISATIANEYANRCPDWIPEEAFLTGKRAVRLSSARRMLNDAEYNSDKDAFAIGPFDMPLGTWNAYRALAKQLRKVIGEAEEKA
jgi:hypothetical protein